MLVYHAFVSINIVVKDDVEIIRSNFSQFIKKVFKKLFNIGVKVFRRETAHFSAIFLLLLVAITAVR